jgi:threonine aldolase
MNLPLSAFNEKIGIDVMTFGGTKNGMMFGEAVLFFRKDLAEMFPFIQKQSLQLASKMRYISAQFLCYLEKELWRKQALHANLMAQNIEEGLKQIANVGLVHPRQTNQLFISMPRQWIETLQNDFDLLLWDPSGIARMITSFNTKEEEVQAFLHRLAMVAGHE